MYATASGYLSHLCHGHGSRKVWTLGGMATGYGIQAQESYCGLEGAALEVESHQVS